MTSVRTEAGAPAGYSIARTASAERIIRALLFCTILASPFVFIEPSPYEGAVLVFTLACVALGVRLEPRVLPLMVLLALCMIGGLFSLIPVAGDQEAVRYLQISIYLQVTALIFACVFAADTERRLAAMSAAYVLAAVFTALLALLGYFQVLPGPEFLTDVQRAQGTFKDPNVFGPFLVLPTLLLIQALLVRGLRLRNLLALAILLSGLFISFSRGAWGHFIASTMLMGWLIFVTAPSNRFRARLVAAVVIGGLGIAGLLAMLLSFGTVSEMFNERATLLQSYDSSQAGRFATQAKGFERILERPNGFGPLQFAKELGSYDPHNVYLNAFASYGWLGGFAYTSLVLVTLVFGFRSLLVRTPWQPTLIATYATFAGVAAEGFVIDTDHWRHFYLLLGIIWGLIAATEKGLRPSAPSALSRPARGALPMAAATGPETR